MAGQRVSIGRVRWMCACVAALVHPNAGIWRFATFDGFSLLGLRWAQWWWELGTLPNGNAHLPVGPLPC